MNEFHYQGSQFFCEAVPVRELALKYGTPLYVYSRKAFENRYAEVKEAFREIQPLICYSVKSNSNLGVLNVLARLGAGADIVSGGELYRALKAGIAPANIVYAGVGKTDDEIRYALSSGIRLFNAESMQEIHAISRIASALNKTARIGLRINPDVDAKTHAKTTTGKKENKFGLPIDQAEAFYHEAVGLPNLKVAGIDVHLGSPIYTIDPYVEALNKLLPLISKLRQNGVPLEELDLGGGFAIVYNDETPFTPAQLSLAVTPLIKQSGLKCIFEPGRYISGASGVLAANVTYVKKTDCKNFIITDAGMNDLIRPAFYGSHHTILPAVKDPSQASLIADIVGPICESSDVFAKQREIPEPRIGETLVMLNGGAYGFAMASNYNSRARACEVLVDGDAARVVRSRESYEDLIRGESVAL